MSGAEPPTNAGTDHPEPTTVGNYFVSNYPPYSVWTPEQVPAVEERLARPPEQAPPLGLYVHLPFCRKRCDFCYFKVYTDKNSEQIRRYLDGVIREARAYADTPYLRGRAPRFVYFGGGTPSYLSVPQLEALFAGLQEAFPFARAEEVAFECEPGTLQEPKIEALRALGVTRLSLGVENFDADILEWNNRAHRAKEIYRAYDFARQTGFDQINIDLIAGMVGETEENWRRCIEETVRLAPEAVTIYQMEVPYNTTIYQRMKDGSTQMAPVADWDTKRRWTDEAFRSLEAAGYTVGSAYTAVKGPHVKFLYRDALWHGADMVGLGVSSFGHLGGIHAQNEHQFDPYLARVEEGSLPLLRAHVLTDEERLLREFLLQLKLGRLDVRPFQEKFGVDLRERFRGPLARHAADGFLEVQGHWIVLSREGLLQVDRLLHAFFLPQHRAVRYA